MTHSITNVQHADMMKPKRLMKQLNEPPSCDRPCRGSEAEDNPARCKGGRVGRESGRRLRLSSSMLRRASLCPVRLPVLRAHIPKCTLNSVLMDQMH